MQTTGHDSTPMCVMTQLLRTTLDLFQLYDCNQHPHLTYQYCQETCHITEVHKSRCIHPPWLLRTKNTRHCWRTQSFILIRTHLPMYQTAQFNWENLNNLFLSISVTVFGITMSSQYMHFLFHDSTGQSILSTLAILLHQSALVTSHLIWHWLVTHLHMDTRLWRNFCYSSCVMALLDHIWGSGKQSTINGYMIHSHQFQSSKPTSAFWVLQTSIDT